MRISIGGERLNDPEADLLAWRDGFRHPVDPGGNPFRSVGCFALMMQFWAARLPFRGWITYWDFSRAEFERTPVKPWQRSRSVIGLASRLAAAIDVVNVLEGL